MRIKKSGIINLFLIAALSAGMAACGEEEAATDNTVISEKIAETDKIELTKVNTDNNGNMDGYAIVIAEGGVLSLGGVKIGESGKVMSYQEIEEEPAGPTGKLNVVGSSITISEESEKYETSPLFFITAANAFISLKNTELTYGSNILLQVSGEDGKWGNAQINAENQELIGDIVTDKTGSASVDLKKSVLEGCINNENTGDVSVMLDKESSWNVTGDSYITVLANEEESCSNIVSKGHMVYYDSSNSVNSWLNGKTIELEGGGALIPVKNAS